MQKKRKAGSQPAKTVVPAARSARLPGGSIVWILPVFGALALVFSWLAALGGSLADGPVDARYFFQGDTFIPYGVFRDLFLDDGYSASGWLYGSAPYYFLDFAFQWALFALGLEPPLALWLFPLLQVAFAAAGWILVCDFLFGKSPVRRTAVLLLHAATFLHLAWFENGLFMLQMTGTWRYGTWACVPWLLWLALRSLNAPPGKTAPPANFAALAAAVAVVVASDLVIAPWLLAPAAALALFFVRPQVAGIFILALGAGTAAGRALAAAAPVEHHEGLALSFDSDRIVRNLRLLHFYLGRIVDFNPMEFLLLPIFAAALVWRAAGEFIPGEKQGGKTGGNFAPFGLFWRCCRSPPPAQSPLLASTDLARCITCIRCRMSATPCQLSIFHCSSAGRCCRFPRRRFRRKKPSLQRPLPPACWLCRRPQKLILPQWTLSRRRSRNALPRTPSGEDGPG